jgi:hypothetical protein
MQSASAKMNFCNGRTLWLEYRAEAPLVMFISSTTKFQFRRLAGMLNELRAFRVGDCFWIPSSRPLPRRCSMLDDSRCYAERAAAAGVDVTLDV